MSHKRGETWLHGSPAKYGEFDVNKSNPSNIYGKAQYLTQDEIVAKRYATNKGTVNKVDVSGKRYLMIVKH